MSQNIYDLANELERSIRALPEYQAVAAAKTEIDNDSDAKTLWTDFIAFQEKVQGLVQSGQMPSTEDQEAMQSFGQKIEANAIVKSYFDAQQALSVYIGDVERIVFAPLQDLVQ